MQKLLVYKSSLLVNATGTISIGESRLFDLILGKMHQDLEIDSETDYQIYVDDFAERFNLEKDWAYKEIKESFRGLMNKSFTIPAIVINGEELPETKIESNWLQHIAYNDKERFVRVRFTTTTAKLVSNLDKSKGYLVFDLEDKKFLSSTYHAKIFDLLKNNAFKRKFIITVLELRRILDIEYKYKNFSQFREKILEPAIEAINATTRLRVSWEPNKGTRQIQNITFIILELQK